LRGSLTFIERALGIEKACELYEAETGRSLSQSELSRRLTADGYPVPQPHISRMREAVTYLLPAIPTLLYGGLGRSQIERLTLLRKASQRLWDRRATRRRPGSAFTEMFQDVLAQFDGMGDWFSVQRVQDELLGQLAGLLESDYDTLALELEEGENWQQALLQEPTSPAPPPQLPLPAGVSPMPARQTADGECFDPPAQAQPGESAGAEIREGHSVSPGASTERLRAIRKLTAEHLGEPLADFASTGEQTISAPADGLGPIPNIWFIAPALDEPGALRMHIAQLAQEIAAEADLEACIDASAEGIGYRCRDVAIQAEARPLFGLLSALSGSADSTVALPWLPADDLAALLLGAGEAGVARLSDAGLIKLFRVLRLARRVLELEVPQEGTAAVHIC